MAMGAMIEELTAEVDGLTPGKKRAAAESAGSTPDGKELQRQAKINKFKNSKYAQDIQAQQQQQQQQQGGGINWINLIILLLTLYSQYR